MKNMRILVINPNTNTETTERIRLVSETTASDGTSIEAVTAPFGQKLIKTLRNTETAGEAVQAVLLEKEKSVDAAVIAAFSDPGLREAKENFNIPVVGIAESAMLKAAEMTDRFSIVTMGDTMVDYLHQRAHEYGVGEKLVNVQILPWDTRKGRPDDISQLTLACAKCIERDCAGVVIIGGGPLAGYAENIATIVHKPILDGVICAIQRAEDMVNRKRN